METRKKKCELSVEAAAFCCYVVNSRESHKIYHVIKFVPRLQKVLYGQYGGGFLFLKRSIFKKVSH